MIEKDYLQQTEVQKKQILLMLDYLVEVAQSQEFLALVAAGRHRTVHLIVLRFNFFLPTKISTTINLDVTQLILSTTRETFKNDLDWKLGKPCFISQIVRVTRCTFFLLKQPCLHLDNGFTKF